MQNGLRGFVTPRKAGRIQSDPQQIGPQRLAVHSDEAHLLTYTGIEPLPLPSADGAGAACRRLFRRLAMAEPGVELVDQFLGGI